MRSARESEFNARGFAKQVINSEATRGLGRPARACETTGGRMEGGGKDGGREGRAVDGV